MRTSIILYLVLVCTASVVEAEKYATLTFYGASDASAAVALSDGKFLAADDENNVQPIYINGQTGRTSGKKQASMKAGRKLSMILFLIAVFIGIISLLIGAASIAVPMLLVIGILGFVLALIIGLGSAVPMIVVWQFNKDNQSKTIGYFS